MRRIVVAVCVVMLTGCVVPHRDVMVFGTDTSFGVSVGADPVNAQVANVAIGYKRREAVWMPLLVNGQDSKAFCKTWDSSGACTEPVGAPPADPKWNPKYTSKSKGVDPSIGGKDVEQDTYSVFASFGGDASGAAGQARVALAQFFATGVAAQRLGSNPSAAQLVSTAPAVDVEGEQAKGKAEAWEAIGVASAAQHKENVDAATDNLGRRKTHDAQIADYVFAGATLDDRQARLEKLLNGLEIPEIYRGRLEGALGERVSFERILAGSFNNRNGEIAANIPAASN